MTRRADGSDRFFPRIDAQPYQHVAAERLDQRHAFRRAGRFERDAHVALGHALQHLFDQRQALLDFPDADPDARIHVAFLAHRDIEAQFVVRRIADRPARVEVAARGAPDRTAGGEASRQVGRQNAGAHRAVLQRGGRVVEFHQVGEAGPHFADQRADRAGCVGGKLDRDAAGHDAVHHQPVAEAGGGTAQHALAQHAAMGQHDAERGVVADRPEIAEVVGNPLEFRQHAAQPHGARRRLDAQRRFHRARERQAIGNRAVARRAAGEARGVLECRAMHQALDALVRVAEALLEPHHRFAIGGEAEMARLDDAGVHRPHRNLMQAVALDRQERIRRRIGAVGEPRPRIGQPDRVEAEQVAHGAFQPDRRCVRRADRRIFSPRAIQAQHGHRRRTRVQDRHVRPANLAPKPEQRPVAGGKPVRGMPPRGRADDEARKRAVPLDHAAGGEDGAQRLHGQPSSAATCWNQATSGPGR